MPLLTYLGHEAFLVETSKAKIIIDPYLTGNPQAKIAPTDVDVDYILLTHAHQDHYGDTDEIAKRCDATVISTLETAAYCETKGSKTHPMNIGGGFNFDFGRVKLTMALHSNSVDTPNGVLGLGVACGFLLTADGKTIYHAGDTALFYDMKLIGELNNVDIALLPIGDNYTMGIDDAVIAAEFVGAKQNYPMHYNTFELIQADPNEFASKAASKGLNAGVLTVGETLEY